MSMFNNDKIAVIGDLHIGCHQSSEEWFKKCIEYGKWLKKELTAKGIRDIVFLGDINDNRKMIYTTILSEINTFFDLFKDFNLVLIVGNHDSYYNDRNDVNTIKFLGKYDNITIIDSVTNVDVNGKSVTFCPWAFDPKSLGSGDVLFGHLELNSFKQSFAHVCNDGLNPIDLVKNYGLIFSGHFHLRDERVYKNGKIIYTGSAYELNYGDIESIKGYYVLDITDSSYTFFENNISPKHVRMSVDKKKKKRKNKTLKKYIVNNIIKLIVSKNIEQKDLDKLIKAVNICKPFEFSVEYDIQKSVDTKFDSYDEQFSVLDNIVEFVEENVEDDFKKSVIKYITEKYETMECVV